ncbi:hypothetical protein DW078_24850 [Bacteroides fragilis]|nr:hypothetical protein DW078_24850 [Bacteroides fragilis]
MIFESWLICEKILLVQTRNEFYIFFYLSHLIMIFESWLICEKILLVQTRNEFYIFKKNVSNKRYGLKGITCPNMNYCEDNLNGRGWRHLMTLLLLVSI